MARRRSAAAGIALVIIAGVFAPTPYAAAQRDKPTIVPGPWHGTVSFGGSQNTHTTVTGASDTRWLTSPSVMAIELVVDDEGVVTSGSLEVELHWDQFGDGSDPNGNPFTTFSRHVEKGTLQVSGTIERMVAEGTLQSITSDVTADGSPLPEVGGTDPESVEWIFEGTESACAVMAGSLAGATGRSIMSGVLRPVGGDVVSNTLRADSRIWPDNPLFEEATDDAITLNDLNDDVEQALVLPPTTPELLDLIDRVDQMVFRLAELDRCQLAALGFADGGSEWMALVVAPLIEMALERVDELGHFEVIRLVRLAGRAGLLSIDDEAAQALYDDLGRALDAKLIEAIIAEDFRAIVDVMLTAGRYGYDWLHTKADEALGSSQEDG